MKKIFIALLCFSLAGCSGLMTPEKIDEFVELSRDSMYSQGHEIIIDISYKKAFDLVLEVFQEKNMPIRKKDFLEKYIMAGDDLHDTESSPDPALVFFEELDGEKTKLAFVGGSPLWWRRQVEAGYHFRKIYNN